MGKTLAISLSFFGVKNWEKYPPKGHGELEKGKSKVLVRAAGIASYKNRVGQRLRQGLKCLKPKAPNTHAVN